MKKYYIGIGIISFLCFIVVVAGFVIAGLPTSEQAMNFDQQRQSDFVSISSDIQGYYSQNQMLPATLNAIPSALQYTDPNTESPYAYQRISPNSYELCADFATRVTPSSNSRAYDGGTLQMSQNAPDRLNAVFQHKKGYDCVVFYVTSSWLTPTPSYGYNTYSPGGRNSVAILHPNNSETVCIGDPYTIEWTVPTSVQGISIDLYPPGSSNYSDKLPIVGVIKANTNTAAEKGTYTWNVPASIDSKAITPGFGYHIQISTYSPQSNSDYSSDLFAIANCQAGAPSPSPIYPPTASPQSYRGN